MLNDTVQLQCTLSNEKDKQLSEKLPSGYNSKNS